MTTVVTVVLFMLSNFGLLKWFLMIFLFDFESVLLILLCMPWIWVEIDWDAEYEIHMLEVEFIPGLFFVGY